MRLRREIRNKLCSRKEPAEREEYKRKEIKCCEVLSKDNAQQEGCVPNGIVRTAFCFENMAAGCL